MPRAQFPEDQAIQPGMQFQAQRPDGESLTIVVTAVDGDTVTIDANHPLAGQVLHFDVSVEGIRDATEEEVAQGHPG